MSSAALVTYFQVISLVGAALTDIKLFHTGLHRKYPVFFGFLLFFVFASTTPLLFDYRSRFYQKLWVTTELFLWMFEILVVRELYQLILMKYKGLFTLGRWAMYGSVVIAVSLSILSLLPKITPAMPQASRIMGYMLAIERGVDLSLALFILLILTFLTLYPTPLPRNVIIHAAIYSIFFISNSLGILVRTILGLRLDAVTNSFMLGVSSLCMIAWFFLLKARGEEAKMNLPWISSEHEERILEQLEAINATILRAARR